MDFSERRHRFRQWLNGSQCVYPASVFDGLSARMADDLGFEVAMFAGSVASMTVTGAPDLMGMTLTEFSGQAYRIARASKLPLLVDADDGYGNAINVMRTVCELENAGVAAMTLEDTKLPQPFGYQGKTQLISLEEGVKRIEASVASRSDENFVIVGRTSAAILTNFDDAIARLHAYADAGADAIFPVGIRTLDEVGELYRVIGKPMIVYAGTDELSDMENLAARGVRVALQSHAPFAAAVQAVYETLRAQREGVAIKDLPCLADKELIGRVTRQPDYMKWMSDFVC